MTITPKDLDFILKVGAIVFAAGGAYISLALLWVKVRGIYTRLTSLEKAHYEHERETGEEIARLSAGHEQVRDLVADLKADLKDMRRDHGDKLHQILSRLPAP